MKINSFKSIFVFLFLIFITEVCLAEPFFYLGAQFLIEEKKLPIKDIFYNSLAYKNGLLKGDIILKYNDINVTDFKAFTAYLKGLNIGDSLIIEFLRNGKKMTKTIRIEDCPKKLPFSTDSVIDGKIKTIKGGNTYFYGEKFLLWQQSSKTKKWISEIPTLNDSCVYKLDKYYKNEFKDHLGINTITGETIEYSPISHTVVAVKAYCENFTERKRASLVTEKVANEVSDKLNLLPIVEKINDEFGYRYVFQYPTVTYDEPVIIQPVWENNTGSVEITCTSKKMQELLKNELAQVEKYTDFNKKERNVPTQLGGYRLGDVPIAKKVKDREKGIFEAKGEFKFSSEGYTYIRSSNFLSFMNFEFFGRIYYTPTSHKIYAISLFNHACTLKNLNSEIPNKVRELLVADVKELENRLGIKAIRETEGKYIFNFPSKTKTKLILELDKVRYDDYNNLYNYVYIDCGVIKLTLTSDEMTNIFNKEKAEILAIKKAE